MTIRRVEVVPHDPKWGDLFAAEAERLTLAFGDNAIEIYHIGSTSISTIYAKPIIDILVEVRDIDFVEATNLALAELGYTVMGEHGIHGRRFFLKNNAAGIRTHHIHTFETGSPQIDRHLAFRDYLRSHPETARAYSELKQQLARSHPTEIEKYMDGKDGFIREIDRQAAQWKLPRTGV